MENCPMFMIREEEAHQIRFPTGFRFNPTDKELIVYYLLPKTLCITFVAIPIGEADLKELEPWQLPSVAKMGEDEWYFFCFTVKRYPTGKRTYRGTKHGYWKATGKDKQIYRGKDLVGMKKTLVFYQGKAPNGHKSNWVMHEYRLDGVYSKDNLPESAQSDWVISRVFHKKQSGKRTHISDLPPPPDSQPDDVTSLPPLTDHGAIHIDTEHSSIPVDTSNPTPPFPPYSPYFADDLGSSIWELLNDDNSAGNDFMASFNEAPSEVTGPGRGSGYMGGRDLSDTNAYLNV